MSKNRSEEPWQSEVAAEAGMQDRERTEIEAKTMKDPGTGIWNRRAFFELGAKLVSERSRDHQPVSVMMLDLDHLKQLNEKFGHPGVDELLKQFAQNLTSRARLHDIVARYGGDEFAIVLASGADEKVMKRFSEPVEANFNDESVQLTFQIGAAELDPEILDAAEKLNEALKKADEILMEKKRQRKAGVLAR